MFPRSSALPWLASSLAALILSASAGFLLPAAATAQGGVQPGGETAAAGIVEAALLLRQLDGEKRVLMIGAHPDDEDTALLAVLARGYSLTQLEIDATLVTDSKMLDIGDRIQTRFSSGTVISRVEELDNND